MYAVERGGFSRPKSGTHTFMWAAVWLWTCVILTAYSTSTGLNSLRSRSHHPLNHTINSTSHPLTQRDAAPFQIPRILHQIYLEGEAKYEQRVAEGQFSRHHRASCQQHHQQWEYILWSKQEADALVKEAFPWFWMTWTNYKHWVMQTDVLRYMFLHSYGGLYLDMDVQCFSAADESLGNFTVVLQGTGPEVVTNAIMASAAKNAFWLEVLYTCQERATSDSPIYATGPNVVRDTVQRLFGDDAVHKLGFHGEIIQVTENATTIKAYPKGSWFAPCFFGEHECFQHLDEMMAAGSIDMEGVVGAHRHQASWML